MFKFVSPLVIYSTILVNVLLIIVFCLLIITKSLALHYMAPSQHKIFEHLEFYFKFKTTKIRLIFLLLYHYTFIVKFIIYFFLTDQILLVRSTLDFSLFFSCLNRFSFYRFIIQLLLPRNSAYRIVIFVNDVCSLRRQT